MISAGRVNDKRRTAALYVITLTRVDALSAIVYFRFAYLDPAKTPGDLCSVLMPPTL